MTTSPRRRGRLVVVLMLLFAMGFTVGGYFAVKWVTARRAAGKAGAVK